MHNIVALILAAGQSKRFGSPKQLLKWKDSNLLENAIKTVNTSNVTHTFLVLGANFDEILKMTDTNSVEIIRNHYWKKGLGNSIAFGVSHIFKSNIKVDGILLMLADQPLIDSEYLNALTDTFKLNNNQIIASSYLNDKKGVPVLFDKSYFDELTILKGDKGAKALIEKYSKNVTLIKGENKLVDIDTFEDYEQLYHANHQ